MAKDKAVTVKEIAKKCKNRKEMVAKYRSDFSYAHKHNMLDDIFSSHINNGYALNRIKTGYYSDKDLFNLAKKYKTRQDFRKKNINAATSAARRGLMDKIFANHINNSINKARKKNGYWTYSKCKKYANKCKTRKEFRTKYPKACTIARRKKWMDKLCKNMFFLGNRKHRYIYAIINTHKKIVYIGLSYDPYNRFKNHKRNGYKKIKNIINGGAKLKILSKRITIEKAAILEKKYVSSYAKRGFSILNSATPGAPGGSHLKYDEKDIYIAAHKCKNRNQFMNRYPRLYYCATRVKLLNKIFDKHNNQGYMRNHPGYWDTKNTLNVAKTCKTRKELQNKHPGAYASLVNSKKLDRAFSKHKNKGYKVTFWTINLLKKEASKYKTRKEFERGSNSAYGTAVKRGVMHTIFNNHKNNGYKFRNLNGNGG